MNSMRTAARYSNGTTVVSLFRQENERHPERRLPESKDRSDSLDLILRDGFPGTIVCCLS
jgi:hypothetical protein